MTDTPQMEAAKKRLADNRAAQEKARNAPPLYGVPSAPEDCRPTPTQEENDLARLGGHITEHEPDGSPEMNQMLNPGGTISPASADTQTRQVEARKPTSGTGYQTRSQQPAGKSD